MFKPNWSVLYKLYQLLGSRLVVIALSCDAYNFATPSLLHHTKLDQTIWLHLSFLAMQVRLLSTPLDLRTEPCATNGCHTPTLYEQLPHNEVWKTHRSPECQNPMQALWHKRPHVHLNPKQKSAAVATTHLRCLSATCAASLVLSSLIASGTFSK